MVICCTWSVLLIIITTAITNFYYVPVRCLVFPCRQFSPPVAVLLSSFPGILPPVYVVTPIHVDQFALELENHPSQPQLSFVLEGSKQGVLSGL